MCDVKEALGGCQGWWHLLELTNGLMTDKHRLGPESPHADSSLTSHSSRVHMAHLCHPATHRLTVIRGVFHVYMDSPVRP